MTENEFRDALKQQIGQSGLSSDRQTQVLARMKGEERKVRTTNKMKTCLVLAALVVLGTTVAVASCTMGINWAGEKVEVLPLTLVQRSDLELAMERFVDEAREVGESVYVWQIQEDGQKPLAWFEGGSNAYAGSIEELQAWIASAEWLPWPEWLPEGYTMDIGRVGFACKWPGGHVLRQRDTFEDAYEVVWIAIPEEYRFVYNYTLRLENETGEVLYISASMGKRGSEKILRIPDGATAERISVADMSDALLVEAKDSKELVARRYLGRTLQYTQFYVFRIQQGDQLRLSEQMNVYDSLALQVQTTDPDLTADDLLSVFGLKTE